MTDQQIYPIQRLGPCAVRSPLTLSSTHGDGIGNFTPDHALVRHRVAENYPGAEPDNWFWEMAGPREHIYFEPSRVKAAIVTCGGLCPGLNDVIRSVYRQLYNYGVPEVLGIRDGYRGMNPDEGRPPVVLTPPMVEDIHRIGGTILGSSRGGQDVSVMVDFLQENEITILFCIGGDGTQRGNHAIATEAMRRDADIAVVGIPKTIDNDISYVDRTFGFNTAIAEAAKVLDCAHVEARGAPNGIGLVKLMGRDSGFIAAGATLASQEVNFCLVPEVPFELEGPDGFLPLLRARILRKQHALVVVAEGAGQELFEQERLRDPTGNAPYHDIGLLLKSRFQSYFKDEGMEVNVKYIDPSYIIRSVPANADDSLFCDRLARQAVHAALSGRTDMLIGSIHRRLIHVPIPMATETRKKLNPEGFVWISVHETTGQPLRFRAASDTAQ